MSTRAAVRGTIMGLLLAAWLARPAALCAERLSDILVVADAMPTKASGVVVSLEHPAYYEAVWVGFRDLGAVIAGEKRPDAELIKQRLVAALARKGYLEATAATPAPTLLIFLSWGTLKPDVVTTPGSGTEGGDETTFYNSTQMLAFLGAHKVARQSGLTDDSQRLASATREEHYFLAVAAYDRASMLARKRKLRWMTRVAVESSRVWLPEVLPEMVAAGAMLFGEDSDRPVWIDPNDRRKPKVELGPVQVTEYIEPTPATRR